MFPALLWLLLTGQSRQDGDPSAQPQLQHCSIPSASLDTNSTPRCWEELSSVPATPTEIPWAGESHQDGHRVVPRSGKIPVGNQLGWSWEVLWLLTLTQDELCPCCHELCCDGSLSVPAFTLGGKGHELRWSVLGGQLPREQRSARGRDVCLLQFLWKRRSCNHTAGFPNPSVVPDQVCLIHHFKNILF